MKFGVCGYMMPYIAEASDDMIYIYDDVALKLTWGETFFP